MQHDTIQGWRQELSGAVRCFQVLRWSELQCLSAVQLVVACAVFPGCVILESGWHGSDWELALTSEWERRTTGLPSPPAKLIVVRLATPQLHN